MRLLIFSILLAYIKCEDYFEKRARILDNEARLAVGGNIILNEQESIVNDCLMQHKFNEVNYGFEHPDFYNFSHHFFSYKDKMATSKVFQIIKAMPKGAILHVHDLATMGADYMLNITYMEKVYVCFGTQIRFRFSNTIPNITCDDHWQLMSDIRNTTNNITEFDIEIKKHFTLVVENPDIVYPNITETWVTFRKYFGSVYGLLTYKPIWKQYIYDTLKAFKEDNIMYAELRTSLPYIYELNGTIEEPETRATMYQEIINKFMEDYPEFIGAKLIIVKSRKIKTIGNHIEDVNKLRAKVPELIIGFDLIGQEDLGKPLIDFVPELKTVKDMDFFFHAGETNWYGTETDENLIDAVLLGAKRIGHAYALTKHPLVMKEIIERDIGIEVNVISNVVLSLVRDIRNHPLTVFLSQGLPVVLSSDDPGIWEADPLSDDFYVTFLGVASKHADLRMLKTLALNSLKYSALNPVNKQRAIYNFHTQWNRFITDFVCPL